MSKKPSINEMRMALRKAEGGAATSNEAMLRRSKRLQRVEKPVSISPLQLARGWAAGTTGLPGDVESLARLLIPGVSEENVLPTSEEMLKRIPFAADDEVGQRAAEIGTLFGGFGVGTGAKAAKAAGKAIAPKAGELAEQYMMRTGMALPMDAWHGSKNRFPPTAKNPLGEFDPTKIGTGEGAQMYGIGHYLAESPNVAKRYTPRDEKYESKLLSMYNRAEARGDYSSMEVLESAMMHSTPEELRKNYPNAAKLIDQIAKIPQKGSLYKVDLPDDQIVKMIDWDKPFSQQPAEIQDIMRGRLSAEDMSIAKKYDSPGSVLYQMISASDEAKDVTAAYPGAEQASQYLRERGVPGVKYLDEASRDAGEGTSNFVVFPGNEDILTIKERMKKGGAVRKAGGGVSLDAMRMAVGGMAEGGFRPTKAGIIRRTVEEARRLHEAAQKTRSKAAQQEAGLYHPIGGGVKLSKPVELMSFKAVDDPSVSMKSKRFISPEEMQGGVAIPLIGDRAEAGKILTDVGDIKLSKPVKLQGGFGHMLANPDPWASGEEVISRLSNLTRMAADLGGTNKVYAPTVSMSPTGVDFNAMVAQTILGQYDPSSITKKAKKEFLNDIRNYVPDKKKPHIKPGSVLTEADLNDVEALREKMLLPNAGPLRKAFVERLGIKKFQNIGFPDVAASRVATTDPELLNIDLGLTGHNIARLDPEGRIIKSPIMPNESYPVHIGGEYFGSLDEPIQYRDFFQGFSDFQRAYGKDPKHDWYTFGRQMPIQQLDQEWLDRVMKSMGKDKPREWKKGGQVKRMAEGGSIKASPSKPGQEFLGRLGQTAERLGIKLEEAMKIVGQEGNSPIKSFLMNMVVSEPLKSAGTALQDYTGTPRDATEDYPYRRLLSGSGMTTSLDPRAVDVASFAAPVASRVSNAIKHLPTDVMKAATAAYGPQATASHVIKPKGGNWLAGGVEDRLKKLKRFSAINFGGGRTNENEVSALNNWIDKQLTRYVKNDMGTPEDPIRALAEKGNIHFNPTAVNDPSPSNLMAKRVGAGMPAKGMGQSEAAKNWEDITDRSIKPASAGSYVHGSLDEDIVAQNPWLKKVDPEAEVYYATGLPRDVHFDHLVDELQNAINPHSGLPKELQLRPESLDRLSVQQAVERVAKINEWRAAQKAEADLVRANNPATVTFKEYPEGYRWAELKTPDMPTGIPEGWSEPVMKGNSLRTVSPDGDVVLGADLPSLIKNIYTRHPETSGNPSRALEDALKYEGEQMGHCVGGYCPDVEEGSSRIYSLRDSKGQPHVTIEVEPHTEGFDLLVNDDVASQIGAKQTGRIVQIKGKGNKKPADKYLPFVQDFVRGGQWSDVGDFKNTGLRDIEKTPALKNWLNEKGVKDRYLTEQEYGQHEGDFLLNQLNPNDLGQSEGMKRGGRVKSAPSLDAMRLATLNKQRKRKYG
jgi:hypothetical protein